MMAVSRGLRFEVFKRDDFTCRYCGRKSPEAILEVDHVIPRSRKGTDDPENLGEIGSCPNPVRHSICSIQHYRVGCNYITMVVTGKVFLRSINRGVSFI